MKILGTTVRNPFKRGTIKELIGRAERKIIWSKWWRRMTATRDNTRPDYEFWDKARRCDGSVAGLEMSGVLLKPLASKTASWTYGNRPRIKSDNPELEEKVNDWFDQHHSQILQAWEEAISLGDYFIVLNPDGSLATVTPDVVEPIVAEDDYSKVIGWRVNERYDHPTELGKWMTVVDDYLPDVRVRIVGFSGSPEKATTYNNLIGKSMCVHIPNNKQSNEVFGKPEADALVRSKNGVLQNYGAILQAGVDGNERQGRPTPVFGFDDAAGLEKFYEDYAHTVKNEESGEESVFIDFDADKAVGLAGGKFDWKSPGPFAQEMLIVLNLLYWLFLEHTEMPEFVMGTAVTSSHASVETQMPVFIQWIQKKRGQIEGWLNTLATLVADWYVLTEPGLGTYETLKIQWDDLTTENGELTLKTVQWLYGERIIDKRTAAELAPVQIEDLDAVLEAAEAEQEESEEQMQREVERQIEKAALTPDPSPAEGRRGEDDEDEALKDAA